MSRHFFVACALLLTARVLAPCAAGQSVSITDVVASSSETDQNSEPSLAVNPADTQQILTTAFSDATSPVYFTGNGGTSWTDIEDIDSSDSTMDWANGGNAYFCNVNGSGDSLQIWRWNAAITQFALIPDAELTLGGDGPDQPRLAANHVGSQDHVYIGFNDLSQPAKTASVYYSLDSGTTWTDQVVENVTPGAGQDGYSIRPAVTGSTVYLCFERWNKFLSNGNFTGDLVIVKDGSNGADGFGDLGVNGTIIASNVQFPQENLGEERTGSDLGMAVSPADPSTIYVAYDVEVGGLAVARIMMSGDGGSTWAQIYQTSIQSALPDLAVTANGAVGLLYTGYENGNIETHFVQSDDNFATHRDEILSRFKNGTPKIQYQPYIGDFEIVKAVGDNFYGTFSASNDTSLYPLPVTFVRDASELGKSVAYSIDPFYFTTGAVDGTYTNIAPAAPAQMFTFSGRGAFSFNVLAGSSDANGDSLALTSVTQGKHGRVTFSVNGDVTYTPGSGFEGFDSFEYTISDGNGGVSTGTVTIETPFYPMAGIYNGLALDNPQTNQGTGIIQSTVNYRGSYTGKIILGGSSYSFSGVLGTSGTASAQATGSKHEKVGLTFSIPAGGGVLSGTAINGSVTSTFAAEVDPYGATNPAPEAGKRFTVGIPHNGANTGSAFPQGDGYGSVTVSMEGLVRIKGALGDGTPFTQSAYLSGSDAWPFYVPIYGKTGSISGGVAFTGTTPALSGSLQWYKPAESKSTTYPAGFTMGVELSGSDYVDTHGQAVIFADNSGTGVVALTLPGGTIITHNIQVSARDGVTVLNPGADKLKLSITASTGAITGSFLDPETSKTLALHAQIVQPDDAYGYFLQSNQFGSVELTK
jgi:hypothetical protein